MQVGQTYLKVCATASALVISSLAVCAAESPANRPTFEYKQYRSIAELTNAIREIKQHLDAVEKKFGSSDTNVAKLLSGLASCYEDLGDDAQALRLSQRSLSIREALLGPDHEDVADSLSELAFDFWGIGDYQQAELLFQRSLTITEKLLGPEHFELATTLNDLADLYREQGDLARALPLCRRALAIRQNVLGREHPDVADSLTTLAQILAGLGNQREALDSCRRSLAISEKVLDPDHPLLADGLFALGRVLSDLKEFPAALSAYQRGLLIDEKISGPDHPTVIEDLSEIAVLFGRQSRWDECLSTSVQLCQRQRRHVIGQTLALSDLRALSFIEYSFESTELLHSVCAEGSLPSSEPASRAGAEGLALNKAFLEEVRAAQAAFGLDRDGATKELRERYREVQVQLDRMAKSRLDQASRDGTRRELQNELSRLEQQLSERSALLAQTVSDRNLTLLDIAKNLKPQAALIDFVQYRRCDFAAIGTNRWRELRYAAYLTFPLTNESINVVVERVDLGEAAPINDAVEAIYGPLSLGKGYANTNFHAALRRLSDLVYAPLARYLTNASHLIICPDGLLSRLPFEMLPVGTKFMVEEKTISYVTSGREVVRLASRKSNFDQSRVSVQSSKSVVMGSPDFDFELQRSSRSNPALTSSSELSTNSPQPENQSLLSSTPMRALSRDYRDLKFKPLPGAEAEARSVAKLLGGECVLRLGADAREAELKAVQSPRVLHLATHGFFLSDQEFKQTNTLRESWMGNWGTRLNACLPQDERQNPLLRCGIALAGANHAQELTNAVAEDGLLTGLEASQLNLQGTELVILSACDSGSGEVKIGEGVMSLRRAFRIAGAESVLASHWKVSDEATTQLMTEFMRCWRLGAPRAAAWREAQLALLRSKEFCNPYFWAAFTLTGQWR
jgi:CHAT domain-containing protein/tetratricopeptide (TPR) repeat protein